MRILAAGLGASLLTVFALHFYLIDGIDGFLFSLAFAPEDTEYASGYNDFSWRLVRIGMTEGHVHHLLGPPLDRWLHRSGGGYSERWSRSPGDTHYRCRVIVYERGRVVRKHNEYYVD